VTGLIIEVPATVGGGRTLDEPALDVRGGAG
jgi:hypothetical protein